MTPLELRTARDALNLTQSQLGLRVGRSLATVCRWENGKTPIPFWLSRWIEELRSAALPAAPGGPQAVQYVLDGRALSAAERAALPEGATYWKSEPGGSWSEWRRGAPGVSDEATGQVKGNAA